MTTKNLFVLVVDINAFTPMVIKSEGNSIAQFIRDILYGGIQAVESNGGDVVAFMGDAFLGILPTAQSVINACLSIAKDLDKQCEYISDAQKREPTTWDFCTKGPSLKIGVEYGWIDIEDIQSRFLGVQRLHIGHAINYANRILGDGEGNRCHIGPEAATEIIHIGYSLQGPQYAKGKKGEPDYEYWCFDMGDIWREGHLCSGDDNHWG